MAVGSRGGSNATYPSSFSQEEVNTGLYLGAFSLGLRRREWGPGGREEKGGTHVLHAQRQSGHALSVSRPHPVLLNLSSMSKIKLQIGDIYTHTHFLDKQCSNQITTPLPLEEVCKVSLSLKFNRLDLQHFL